MPNGKAKSHYSEICELFFTMLKPETGQRVNECSSVLKHLKVCSNQWDVYIFLIRCASSKDNHNKVYFRGSCSYRPNFP